MRCAASAATAAVEDIGNRPQVEQNIVIPPQVHVRPQVEQNIEQNIVVGGIPPKGRPQVEPSSLPFEGEGGADVVGIPPQVRLHGEGVDEPEVEQNIVVGIPPQVHVRPQVEQNIVGADDPELEEEEAKVKHPPQVEQNMVEQNIVVGGIPLKVRPSLPFEGEPELEERPQVEQNIVVGGIPPQVEQNIVVGIPPQAHVRPQVEQNIVGADDPELEEEEAKEKHPPQVEQNMVEQNIVVGGIPLQVRIERSIVGIPPQVRPSLPFEGEGAVEPKLEGRPQVEQNIVVGGTPPLRPQVEQVDGLEPEDRPQVGQNIVVGGIPPRNIVVVGIPPQVRPLVEQDIRHSLPSEVEGAGEPEGEEEEVKYPFFYDSLDLLRLGAASKWHCEATSPMVDRLIEVETRLMRQQGIEVDD